MKLSKMDDEKNDCDGIEEKDGGIEKVKTITVNQLYKVIKKSNMMGYIDSEEALIRMIKKMIEGKPAIAMYFEFLTTKGKRLNFKILLKNLEN